MIAARHSAGILCWVLLLALLSACAAPPQTRQIADQAPAGLPLQVELKQVPFFPQSRYQCGPAALATVLNVQGFPVEPEALVSEVYIPERRGTLQTEILAAMRARDLVAYVLKPELEDVLRELAAGHPVLVLQNLSFNWLPRWHYAVLVGYDLISDEVILRSGTVERQVHSMALFERTWRRGEHWAVVAVPPDRLPATVDALTWLRSASDLEGTGRLTAAGTAYQTAIRRWPDQSIGWIGLGNVRYAEGDYAGAEAALRGLLARDPHAHAGWNNLAHILGARRCGGQARDAAACARALAPGEATYLQTLDTLRDSTDKADCGADPLQCPVSRHEP